MTRLPDTNQEGGTPRLFTSYRVSDLSTVFGTNKEEMAQQHVGEAAMIKFSYLLFQLISAPRNQIPMRIPNHVC